MNLRKVSQIIIAGILAVIGLMDAYGLKLLYDQDAVLLNPMSSYGIFMNWLVGLKVVLSLGPMNLTVTSPSAIPGLVLLVGVILVEIVNLKWRTKPRV